MADPLNCSTEEEEKKEEKEKMKERNTGVETGRLLTLDRGKRAPHGEKIKKTITPEH